MEENLVTYVNEHLAIGNWGKFSVYVAFGAALFSAFSYLLSFKGNSNTTFWRNLGRAGFFVHSTAVLAIFNILFFIIQRHYFEYQYAWQHSSTVLPLKYMISCFWEGQEGSFLLWMVWHVVIGNILIFTARSWESPVLTIMGIAQVMLSTMLLGIEFFGSKIGSSPFELLRNVTEGPIFARPDYLSFIEDGNGLNPLLQNYWMVIHPPTLFFGFAASIVPFAYAVSALWTRRYTEWVKPALPWALVGVMVLGTGIIMGAFWAYESLTFGGYWAWDPVENASLIPWLILIATVHLMLIYKSTGNALYSTYLFAIFSFLLVLYATFLTRSGVLGNTSVHSFTDLGMSGQLLVFLFIFLWLPTYVTMQNTALRFGYLGVTVLVFGLSLWLGEQKAIFIPYVLITLYFFFKNIYTVNPIKGKEEDFSSREFWMFIGSIVFIISGMHVIISTSLPVFNKLGVPYAINFVNEGINNVFGTDIVEKTDFAPADDVIGYYNKWQLPFALIIAFLTAITQFLKYKKTKQKHYANNIIISFSISLLVTTLCFFVFKIKAQSATQGMLYALLLLSATFAVVGNLYYAIRVMKGKWQFSGASVAHVGFGLLLVGVLVSSANKTSISVNYSRVDLGENFDAESQKEHVLLFKDVPTPMKGYIVTYVGDSVAEPDNFFKINFERLDEDSVLTGEKFQLLPNSQKNPKMGLISNPDTRHYFSHDVFTYVSSVPDKENNKNRPYEQFYQDSIEMGDTIITNNAKVVLDGISVPENYDVNNLRIKADMRVITLYDTIVANPEFLYVGNNRVSPDVEIEEADIKIKFANIITPDSTNNIPAKFAFVVSERPFIRDYVVMMAKKFPYINFVWGGTIIMVLGFLMSIIHRVKEHRRELARNSKAEI